jgi:hypothetical protein
MPDSGSARSVPLVRRVRGLVATLVLVALVCTSPVPRLVFGEAPPQSVSSPKTWVRWRPHHSPILWWIWADVRDYLGEDEWKSIDVSWMPASARADLAGARADLAKVHATWRYQDSCLVGGLWRLDLEREAAIDLLAAHDGDVVWPLATPDMKRPRFLMGDRPFLWRARLERWYRAQPAGEAEKSLRTKLAEAWREAVTSKDAGLAATVVQAMDERFGRESAEALAPEALGLIRETLAGIEERMRTRRVYVFSHELPIDLLERFGVPEQVDLKPFVDGTRRRAAELSGEPIPIPHPYDIELLILRLQRLQDRRR